MVKFCSPLLLFTVFLLLTSCGPSTTKPIPDTPVIPDQEAVALEYLQNGQYSSAAREYQQLANDYPDQANSFYLKAATAWFEDNNDLQAEKVLNQTNIEQDVFPLQALQKTIIEARIANYRQQASTALELLSIDTPDNTPPGILGAFHQTRANAYQQLEQPNSYVVEMLAAFSASEPLEKNQSIIEPFWNVLKARSSTELDSLNLISNSTADSWVSLARIQKDNMADSARLQAALADWQIQYPKHPANAQIVPQIITSADRFTLTPPKNIALILPLSGKYQQAGEAIRDGFVSAWMELSVNKPQLKIYDSATTNINQIYQQAVDQGADFIVGPLLKDNIQDLISNDNIQVNTLVMNYLDNEQISNQESVLPGINFFQLGLSAEQEAKQIAQLAYTDGRTTALVLTPANQKGQNIQQSFRQQFESLGGVVLENSGFEDDSQSYLQNIRALLNSDISKQRASKLKSTLNLSIESETRSRQDADMIFIHSRNVAAKQIVPMLYFEQNGKIPIYATSDIHTKLSVDEDNSDLNNVSFLDIPWLLSNSVSAANKKIQFEQHWPRANYFLYRLYALGHDAYSALENLASLRNSAASLAGLSGELLLGNNGEIQRLLSEGIILNGQAQEK